MNSGVLDFSIGPFPVRVHWSFFLIAVLMGFQYIQVSPVLLISWVVIVFVSVLIHELGHAVVAESYGMFPSILLHSMGGITRNSRSKALSYPQEILLSLAGPFAGFAVGGIVYGLTRMVPIQSVWIYMIVSQLIWVNIGWGILNLIPMIPLDGGNVMRSLWHWFVRPYDERTPLMISIGFGIVTIIVALILRQTFLALLAFYFTLDSFQRLRGGPSVVF